MVNKDMYESLTKDAFKGVPKRDSDKWGLSISVRSSAQNPDELELTWAGSVANTIGGRTTQQKTILGTMKLEKIEEDESKTILQEWVKTMIDERQKFENLSKSLKDHVVNLDQQYSEARDLLADFRLDKRRSQNDLMEKFRMLINTKKIKIAKLTTFNKAILERMEKLEEALKEERKKRVALEGKKASASGAELSDNKKEEDDSDEEVKVKGGKAAARSRGRGKASSGSDRSESAKKGSGSGLAIKRTKKDIKDEGQASDLDTTVPQKPLPHPQDAYGWDDEDSAIKTTATARSAAAGEDEDEDEPLIRHSSRQAVKPSTSSSSGLSTAEESMKFRLEDLTASAQGLLQRVSKAASHVRPTDNKGDTKDTQSTGSASSAGVSSSSTTHKRTFVKREESDQADKYLGRTTAGQGSESGGSTNNQDDSFVDPEGIFPRKRHRVNSGDQDQSHHTNTAKTTKTTSTAAQSSRANESFSRSESSGSTRGQGRVPIVSMRKPGSSKPIVDKTSVDTTSPSPARISSTFSVDASFPSPDTKLSRTASSADMAKRQLGRTGSVVANKSKDIAPPSITDLYKELE